MGQRRGLSLERLMRPLGRRLAKGGWSRPLVDAVALLQSCAALAEWHGLAIQGSGLLHARQH